MADTVFGQLLESEMLLLDFTDADRGWERCPSAPTLTAREAAKIKIQVSLSKPRQMHYTVPNPSHLISALGSVLPQAQESKPPAPSFL